MILPFIFGSLFGKLFEIIFLGSYPEYDGVYPILGIPIAFLFFVPLLFTAFDTDKKRLWLTMLLTLGFIGALLSSIRFGVYYFIFSLLVVPLGWLVGLLLPKLKNFVIPKIKKNSTARRIIIDLLINILLIALVFLLAGLSFSLVGKLYARLFFNESLGNSTVDIYLSFYTGFIPAYLFFLTLIFTLFGRLKKYLWIFILLLPAAFKISFFISEGDIVFPVLLAIIGWLIGWGVLKLKNRFA